MTEGVTRLKQLLFDTPDEGGHLSEFERRFEDASRRLHALEALSGVEKQERLEILRKLEQVFERAGTHDHLSASVAGVLDEALRKAEVSKHDEMARALAPLVVQTIKSELRNSQDEMVQVLYPLTGRMVKSYVASAIKDLADEINRRLEENPVSLRIRSIVSGKSVADLAIAQSQRLTIEEVFLIRRGAGTLVARWPEGGQFSNSDIHLSGILSAINDFAGHAFSEDGGNLRTFELDDCSIYLRASPVYLLAAKCRGIAPTGTEEIFDDAFLSLLERLQQPSVDAGGGETAPSGKALEPLAVAVTAGAIEIYERNDRAGLGFNPLKFLLFLVAVPVFAWLIWWGYTSIEEARTLRIARAAVNEVDALREYRPELKVGYRGRSLVIEGLAPDAASREAALEKLRTALPDTTVEPRLAVFPEPKLPPPPEVVDPRPLVAQLRRQMVALQTELTQQQQRAALRRSLDGTEARLRRLVPELGALAAVSEEAEKSRAVQDLQTRARRIAAEVLAVRQSLDGTDGTSLDSDALARRLLGYTQRVAKIGDSVSALLGRSAALPASQGSPAVPSDVTAVAETLAMESQRASAMTLAVTKAIQQARLIRIPEPQRIEPGPREKLTAFAARHAIFFANGTDFRAPADAARKLDELVMLMRGNAITVRVVGYTDDSGGRTRNSPLADSRAEAVVTELTRRGIPAERLIPVGRADRLSLSTVAGAASPNRRVQFEIAFQGERPR